MYHLGHWKQTRSSSCSIVQSYSSLTWILYYWPESIFHPSEWPCTTGWTVVNNEIRTVSKFYSRIDGNVCIYRMEQLHVDNYNSYAQWLWYGVNIIKLSQGHIFIKKHSEALHKPSQRYETEQMNTYFDITGLSCVQGNYSQGIHALINLRNDIKPYASPPPLPLQKHQKSHQCPLLITCRLGRVSKTTKLSQLEPTHLLNGRLWPVRRIISRLNVISQVYELIRLWIRSSSGRAPVCEVKVSNKLYNVLYFVAVYLGSLWVSWPLLFITFRTTTVIVLTIFWPLTEWYNSQCQKLGHWWR